MWIVQDFLILGFIQIGRNSQQISNWQVETDLASGNRLWRQRCGRELQRCSNERVRLETSGVSFQQGSLFSDSFVLTS